MSLIDNFQDLVAQVPDLVQPFIIAVAGAVPFIEGEGAASIGIVGGIHPVIAVVAAVIGNFLCVAALVLLGAGARNVVVSRQQQRVQERAAVPVGAGSTGTLPTGLDSEQAAPPSARKLKFQRALDRYGVPGVSLLGPLLLPTQFTATMLAAAGVRTARILLWQAVAIIGWTTVIAVLISGVVQAVR